MSTDKKRFEIILQAFVGLSDEQYVGFDCPRCGSNVKATPQVQAQLASGGIGHKCPGCERYYAFVRCPNCSNVFALDDIEWDQLLTKEGGKCPKCKAELFVRLFPAVPLMAQGTPLPGLSNWCEDTRDSEFVKFLNEKLTGNEKNYAGIYHRTTGDRIKAAEDELVKIKSFQIKATTVISNFSGSISDNEKETNHGVIPTSVEISNALFSFINSLRSALDIVSQELANAYLSGKPESDIYFYTICDAIAGGAPPELLRHIEGFQGSGNFKYLNKLRNTTQHRRLPLMPELNRFDLKEMNVIRPWTIRPSVTLYLPDDPYLKYDAAQFGAKREMIRTLDQLFSEVKEFILDLYALAR
jgi:hypothetical protein